MLTTGRAGHHDGKATATSSAAPATLRVDWPNCAGRGLCHELLPELVSLDAWGYPVVAGPVTADLLGPARLAVSACPHSALRLLTGR